MLAAGACASSPEAVNAQPLNVFAAYTTDWAQYRNVTNSTYQGQQVTRPDWCKAYGYTPSHLDAALFTHIIYAFAKIEAGTYAVVSLKQSSLCTCHVHVCSHSDCSREVYCSLLSGFSPVLCDPLSMPLTLTNAVLSCLLVPDVMHVSDKVNEAMWQKKPNHFQNLPSLSWKLNRKIPKSQSPCLCSAELALNHFQNLIRCFCSSTMPGHVK